MQEINGEAFKHLKILVELNLSHNNITHIERGTFRGNDRLQTLNLAGNQVGWTRRGVARLTICGYTEFYVQKITIQYDV